MTTEEKEIIPKKKRSLLSWIGRIVLFGLLGLFVFIIIVMAGLLLYLRPARIEAIVEKVASENLGQEFTFTNAHFNLFNGFVFQSITLAPPDSAGLPGFPVESARAKEISLRYSLAGILQRRVVITAAVIDSPQIHLVVTVPVDSTQMEKAGGAKTASPDSAAAVSAISLNLEKFRLKNASITVDVPDSLRQQHIFLSDLSIALDDLAVPRGDIMAQDSLLSGRLNLTCDQSDVVFEQIAPGQNVKFAGRLNAQTTVTLAGLEKINLDGAITLDQIYVTANDQFTLSPQQLDIPVALSFAGRVNGKTGTAVFEPINFNVQDIPWLSAVVRADSLLSRPFVQADIVESQIPVSQLIQLARPFVPDSLMPDIYLHNNNAAFSLAGTSVSGFLPDSMNGEKLTCNAKLTLRNFGLTLNRNEHFLKNLNITAEAGALLGFNSVEQPNAAVSISFDSLFATLPDSQKAFAGRASVKAKTTLAPTFMPALLTTELTMSNVLGANIGANVTAKMPDGLDTVAATGHFFLDKLDVRPFTQDMIQAVVSARAEFTLNTLQNITATVDVDTDPIGIQQEFEKLTLAPLHLKSTFSGATDTLFQHIMVRSLTANVNDFITSELTATAAIAPNNMAVNLNHLLVSLDHKALLNWLPQSLKEPLAELSVTGKTILTTEAHANLTPADTTYDARLNVLTENLSLDYQNELAALSDIVLNISGHISSDSGATAALALGIGNAHSSQFRQGVFRQNQVALRVSSPDFQSAHIDTGYIQLPDFKTTGRISGDVQIVNKTPIVNAHVSLTQNAADTIRLMQDIYYIGENDVAIDIVSDSTIAGLVARIKTTDLTMSLPNNLRVERMNANIRAQQQIDLIAGAPIISPMPVVSTPTAGLVDYKLYRGYYFQPEKLPSSIDIRRIVVGDYRVDNLHVEAFLGTGNIEIPEFTVQAYGGNIGGAFSLAMNQEDILNSSYKVSAHFSGINSALLLPSRKASEQGIITAHAELTGSGLDIVKGIDLQGYFHITKIESKVADNLLRALDPEGKESGIKMSRLLINYGYKPTLMSFDIGHGYCYPAIFFDQPWYNPFRLAGGGIELARIPLASLANMQTMQQ